MALTFSEWRRENSGTRADYENYLRTLAETARRANTAFSFPDSVPVADADAEIGTTRSVNAAGRELVRAAVAARGGLVTYVAWDGERIAMIVPLPAAD